MSGLKKSSKHFVYSFLGLAILIPVLALLGLAFYFDGAIRIALMITDFVLVVILIVWSYRISLYTSQKFYKFYAVSDMDDWKIATRTFPSYQYVDIYRAILRAIDDEDVLAMDISHNESLSQIITDDFYGGSSKEGIISNRIPFSVEFGSEELFPEDMFWLLKCKDANYLLIRFKYNDFQRKSTIEVAAPIIEGAASFIKKIIGSAQKRSIYRNCVVTLNFSPEIRDSYGDVEQNESLNISFLKENEVTTDNIVLEESIHNILDSAVFDFHRRRKLLKALKVPSTRGLLFYGPPGTGKTYTSKYIASCLEDNTTIVASGNSLLHIRSICNLARELQPALVVLEDVDLAFSDRAVNAYQDVLGDFLDELDGYKNKDSILFILTTNDISRLETAIKDRPGRISQCIYFGPPNNNLRGKYIRAFLSDYEYSKVDVDRLVEITDGVTQVFLQELVYRAVQLASIGVNSAEQLELTTQHFEESLKALKQGSEKMSNRIIGFQVSK